MKKEITPPHIQLAIMSRDYVVSRAIHAIAHLGIADHMSEQAISIKELAQRTATVPELLDRVLSFLSVYGLFSKNGDGYALTPLSAPLRTDHPNSISDVLSMVDECWWQSFAHLETTLKTGTPGFNLQHGTDLFSFLSANPEKKARFQKGINKLATYDDKAITQAFNFGQFKHIVDIGSGQENLAKTINNQYPSTKIDLFNFMAHKQSSDDYFATLPAADAYIFKGRLHDFNDDQMTQILTQCYKAMPPSASLIIAEQVIAADDLPHTNKTMDIIMMVLVGGRQRTLESWCELIETTGFKFKDNYPSQGIYTIMEFFK